jgi:hypothetical protein
MQQITPFLWFDGQAEEAMNFYGSIFKDFKVVSNSLKIFPNPPTPTTIIIGDDRFCLSRLPGASFGARGAGRAVGQVPDVPDDAPRPGPAAAGPGGLGCRRQRHRRRDDRSSTATLATAS